MTDEDYVAELRSHGMLSTNQAADRIEQLTADHNATLARFADALAREINLTAERDKWKTAFDETCDAWQKQCEHEMDKAKAAEAERDRLRAIGTEMAESIEGNYYLPGVATRWVAALKGETP